MSEDCNRVCRYCAGPPNGEGPGMHLLNPSPTEDEIRRWETLTDTADCDCCNAPVRVIHRLVAEVRKLKAKSEAKPA